MRLPEKFPHIVKKGSSVVKIYRNKIGEYEQFRISYYLHGERKRETKPTFEKAKNRADEINDSVADRNLESLTLSRDETVVFKRARELAGGVDLDTAIREWAEARAILGTTPLMEAAKFFRERHPSSLKPQTPDELRVAMVAEKTADGLTEEYLRPLNLRLKHFAKSFQCQMHTITPAMINSFLRHLDVGGRSRNNYRQAIVSLLTYAEGVNAITESALITKHIQSAKEDEVEITTFTPEEMRKLLTTAQTYNPKLIPLLALSAFGAMRSYGELKRQRWSDINFETGFIRVSSAKGGTASKRLIKIRPNLRQWLDLCDKGKSDKCGVYPRPEGALARLAKAAGVTWKRNALRHSYATYRVAETNDIATTSRESGNSVRIITRHYVALKTPAEAEEWFSIFPVERKIIALPKVA